ncbi:unnamed protein product [Rhizoctonia solani]|uniref:Uncharacterized protein n=1 Tax=Rhizoctonia solani TaxID=456999 RepID=A0A8H3DGP0_9AGAM|nr:unnamed protein product [Rhizoctonia solani]
MTVYPAGPAQMPPLDFDILLNSPQEPVEEVATTDETPTSPIKFYTDAYLYPDYSSRADIDRGCGYPTDWDDEDFTGMQISSNSLTDHSQSYAFLCADSE